MTKVWQLCYGIMKAFGRTSTGMNQVTFVEAGGAALNCRTQPRFCVVYPPRTHFVQAVTTNLKPSNMFFDSQQWKHLHLLHIFSVGMEVCDGLYLHIYIWVVSVHSSLSAVQVRAVHRPGRTSMRASSCGAFTSLCCAKWYGGVWVQCPGVLCACSVWDRGATAWGGECLCV